MIALLHSTLGVFIEFITLIGAVLALLPALLAFLKKKMPTRVRWLCTSGALFLIGGTLLCLQRAFPKPKLAISQPMGAVTVEQPNASSGSVRFIVRGTSENVPPDRCIYTLIKVDSEYHVQGCASPDESSGAWQAEAWIGESTHPIGRGSRIHIAAVLAPPGVARDAKIALPSEIGAELQSRQADVIVQNVELPLAQAVAN